MIYLLIGTREQLRFRSRRALLDHAQRLADLAKMISSMHDDCERAADRIFTVPQIRLFQFSDQVVIVRMQTLLEGIPFVGSYRLQAPTRLPVDLAYGLVMQVLLK